MLFTLAACNSSEEENIIPAPSIDNAIFSYTTNPENPNEITFTADPSVETWFTHWDFGDNTSAEGMTAEKIFYQKGDYEVRFKIFTKGGTAETTQTITIENDIVEPNLVLDGGFDIGQAWGQLPISDGVSVSFQNGTAIWSGGGWGHFGLFQPMDIEANTTYQIQMDVAGGGASDCWFEVYVGKTVPQAGVDYTDGGMRLGLSTWDGCGVEPYNGALTQLSCSNGASDGTFEFPESGRVYLVIRSGGGYLGDNGITVDNVKVREP